MKKSFADSHCDTITRLLSEGESLYENSGHVDIKRLAEYKAPLQFFAVWLDPFYYKNPMKETLRAVDFYYSELEKNKEYISHINSCKDISSNKKAGRISALLSLEGAEALEGSLAVLRMFYRLGVRAVTLTWNFRNDAVLGSIYESNKGLSSFGKELVREMERLGMLVDVSHLSDAGFRDVAKISEKPFVASHSNARSRCNVLRNLTDRQIKQIAEKNGVIGINLCREFIAEGKKAALDEIMAHISHIIKRTGFDHIGLGCDFDGIDTWPDGFGGVSEIYVLTEAVERKYGESAAAKFAEENMLRVLKETIG